VTATARNNAVTGGTLPGTVNPVKLPPCKTLF
jgi:hypothetical protein